MRLPSLKKKPLKLFWISWAGAPKVVLSDPYVLEAAFWPTKLGMVKLPSRSD